VYYFICSEQEKTRCELHRESIVGSRSDPRGPRPAPGQYVPTCDANGEYEPMQCHASIRQCWCVDRNGVEISGTRLGPGQFPDCESSTCFTHTDSVSKPMSCLIRQQPNWKWESLVTNLECLLQYSSKHNVHKTHMLGYISHSRVIIVKGDL